MMLNFMTCLFNYVHTRTNQAFLSGPKSNSIQHQTKTWAGTFIQLMVLVFIHFSEKLWRLYCSMLYITMFWYSVCCAVQGVKDYWSADDLDKYRRNKKFKLANYPSFLTVVDISFTIRHILSMIQYQRWIRIGFGSVRWKWSCNHAKQ